MANLVDTSVNGDLRVTGKVYGTANAVRVNTANLAIPPLGNGDQVGSTGDFFLDSGSGKGLPNTTDNFNIHTTVTHFSGTTYRLTQIATPTSASNPPGIYERGASSSDGVTWTFGSWLAAASSSHTHGNIANGGTLTDTAAAASGNDYVVIRDADNAKIQTSTIKGTDVADAVSKKHSHSTLTLSTTAQAYDGSHTLALPSTDPYTSARTPTSHTHGNIANGGTLTDTAAAAAGNDYVVIRDADNAKIQTSTIKGTDVADAVSKKHSHSTLTLSTTAQTYDGTHTLALPSSDPYTSARTPSSHTHGNITNGGTITSDTTVASGDKIAIIDADNNKVARSGIAFDGSTTTTALTPKGTFETFSKLTIGTTSTTAAAGNHTHTTAIASDSSSGTVVTLAHNTQYKLTVGGTSVLFKTPADSNTDTKVTQTKDDSGTTAYPLLMAGAADPNGTATTARYDSGVKLTPSTNTISANISGNAATATNANITRTEDTANGDKLQIGTGSAVNITNAKHAASADSANTATDYAAGGGIANALSGKASTGHLHDDRYIKASSGNKSLSFGGTTTIGTVQGNNVNLVMPEADSDIYYVSANVTSFSDVLAAFNSKQKLILQIGFEVSDTAAAAYNIPLNRIIFSDDIPSTFTWVYTQDRLQGDANRGAITTWSLGSSGWESHSEFTYYADNAGLSNKASALIDFGNTNKMTRVGWEGNPIGKVIATGSSTSSSESSFLAAYYVADGMGHVKDVKAANVQVGSAKSVNADAGESISSTGTNGSMEILNGALTSSSGGGGSCSIDGDGISFTQGATGSSMTAGSISTAGTGTFTGGASAKGRPIDGSATIVSNRSSVYWNPGTTHLVISRSAGSTTIVDLKDLTNGLVYWLHVPRDNIIALKNSSAISTFYCYDEAFKMTYTSDTYNIRSHIHASGAHSHGGFSTAIVRSSNTFYVMMDY